jgi:hypothetical protein
MALVLVRILCTVLLSVLIKSIDLVRARCIEDLQRQKITIFPAIFPETLQITFSASSDGLLHSERWGPPAPSIVRFLMHIIKHILLESLSL